MTVSITSNLVDIDLCQATTGWTSSLGGLGTNGLGPREGTLNLQDQASEGTYEVYHTVTAEDYNGRTIFGWHLSGGPDTEANDGMGMLLGDGTNQIAYSTGGIDNFGFTHIGYTASRLNIDDRPTTNIRTLSGSDGSLDEANITEIGFAGNFPGKAAGNADNVKFDALRYMVNTVKALDIAGGTTGARGNWQEVVTEDESTSNAWGIVKLLVTESKAYQVNFGLEIGDTGATDAFFEDSGFQLYINGAEADAEHDMAAGSMDFDFVGGSATNNLANFSNFFIQSLGTVSNWDMSDTDLTELIWSDGQFVDMGTFLFQAQDAGSKTLTNLIWSNCGQVTLVGIDAIGLVFNGTTDANGAILWNASTVEENQDDLTFNSDGTGHAIEVNLNTASLTTFNVNGYTFDGFAGDSGTAGNRVFFIDNALDGDVTINLTDSEALNVQGGGDGFSVEVAGGYTGTVTINATVDLTVNVEDEAGAAIQNAQTSIHLLDSPFTELMNEDTTAGGVATEAFNFSTPTDIVVKVRKSETTDNPRYQAFSATGQIASTGFTLAVTLKEQPVPI